jgi:hypothetical protein
MRCWECDKPIVIVEGIPQVRYGNKKFCSTTCIQKYLRSQRDIAGDWGGTL